MSNSFQLTIEESKEGQGGPKPADSRIYQAIEEASDESFPRVIALQQLLKMQSLLLEYQEKKKNDRVKEIEYHYTNAYSNYLWTRFPQERKEPFIFLNQKDLLALAEELPAELQTLLARLADPRPLPLRNDLRPSPAFAADFMNFWPLWHLRVREVIELQIGSAEKIESSFESEYTFAAKMLASLRLNDRVQRFCAEVFEPVLGELEGISEELVVDFAGLYDKWGEQLARLPALRRFVEGGDPEWKAVRGEMEELFGRLKGEQEAKILLEEMVHFERKQSPIGFLLAEVGEEEMPEGMNLRLAWLVWKKILSNRKKLEHLATSLLSSVIESFPAIPHEVKYVVRCFRECAEGRFGELRFEDLKSFFNKVVFSQLFFAEFMSLYEARAPSSNNTNLTLLALVSQKIMFGQQFYEKFKFGFLNQVILHYVPTIKEFIRGFISSAIHTPPPRFMHHCLLSLESVRFAYELLKGELGGLQFIGELGGGQLSIASKAYPLRGIFVYLSERIGANYSHVLRPSNKVRRTFTEFLILIDKISEKNNMVRLLEQYRCSQEDIQGNRPSVQLYAIYLSEIIKEVDWIGIANEIEADIAANKREIERIKIGLEKEYNYSSNLQAMYMKILSARRNRLSKAKIEAQINRLMALPFGFQYDIVEGKVCEGSSSSSVKTFRHCLSDICQCFLGGLQGVEGLYHNLCERVVEQLEKGVVPDNLVENAKSILGEKLYHMLKLDSHMSEKDLLLFKQMEKHAFITPEMLDLHDYEAEVEIVVSESQKYLDRLARPLCPDRVLKLFFEITLVFQNVILTTGSATDITADVQIPLMLLTIIRCRVRNMATLVDFVEKFCPDEIYSSVLGQTLTLLKSVLFLIEEMDSRKLNITPEEYSNYVINSSYIIID